MGELVEGEARVREQIETILGLLGQASDKFEPESSASWRWMADHAPSPEIAEMLMRDMTFTMLRMLEAIAQLEPANGISISRQSGIPKGTVSKNARRLVSAGLLTQESLPDNKKEVLFRLTETGRNLTEVHRAFDAQMARGFKRFLERYSEGELAFLVRLLEDLNVEAFLED